MSARQNLAIGKTQKVELTGNQQLIIERNETNDLLQIVSEKGQISLSVEITSKGPVLHFEGCGLKIKSDQNLSVDAQNVHIHGRDSVVITSNKDTSIIAAKDLHTYARIQNIKAALGNVNVKANDDIKLNGERVLVNC